MSHFAEIMMGKKRKTEEVKVEEVKVEEVKVEEVKVEEVKHVTVKYVVSKGKAVTTKRQIKAAGEVVSAADFMQGDTTLEALVVRGIVEIA